MLSLVWWIKQLASKIFCKEVCRIRYRLVIPNHSQALFSLFPSTLTHFLHSLAVRDGSVTHPGQWGIFCWGLWFLCRGFAFYIRFKCDQGQLLVGAFLSRFKIFARQLTFLSCQWGYLLIVFFIHVEVFLVVGVTEDFWLTPGHLCIMLQDTRWSCLNLF